MRHLAILFLLFSIRVGFSLPHRNPDTVSQSRAIQRVNHPSRLGNLARGAQSVFRGVAGFATWLLEPNIKVDLTSVMDKSHPLYHKIHRCVAVKLFKSRREDPFEFGMTWRQAYEECMNEHGQHDHVRLPWKMSSSNAREPFVDMESTNPDNSGGPLSFQNVLKTAQTKAVYVLKAAQVAAPRGGVLGGGQRQAPVRVYAFPPLS